MKHISSILFALLLFAATTNAQKTLPYQPNAKAEANLQKAVQIAKQQNQHVLAIIGGNWCSWCVRLSKYYASNDTVSNYLKQNYQLLKINYSRENKNLKLMKELNFPQRFGFPVIVIIDGKGKLIHTQNSAYLEAGKGYDTKKMLQFMKAWTKAAIDPKLFR